MKTLPHLDRYTRYVDQSLIDEIYRKADLLRGLHVLHINTTATGGGVAEILEAITPVTEGFDIKHTRKIVQLDQGSNLFTTHLLDLLQGNDPGDLPVQEQHLFLDKLRLALASMEETRADIYFVHDFQLVPLAKLSSWIKPALWFSHIDTAHPNPNAESYVQQFLDAYDLYVFNSPYGVFKGMPAERTHVITLGIDPFNPKNGSLTKEEGMELLAHCGIDPQRPLIAQISRFDRWKNPWQAIDVYRLVKRRLPSVQLALVGAMEAADDVRALEILHDLQSYAQGDPDIHLLHDANLIQDREVNAFQHYAHVVLQRSTREGFGLTVTEAMWKCQPVIGTSATGPRTQIVHGQNGYIADDTETCAEYTLNLLQDRNLWRQLGEQAHEYVRTHHLLPMMISDYLDVLLKMRQMCQINGPVEGKAEEPPAAAN